jgi:hypothetical protein
LAERFRLNPSGGKLSACHSLALAAAVSADFGHQGTKPPLKSGRNQMKPIVMGFF